MKKFNLNSKTLEKVGYAVGIITAAGGLVAAVIGDKDSKNLSNRVEELEKKLQDK